MRFSGGREAGWVCPEEARAEALTLVDLTDDWTPTLFAPRNGVEPAFRARYRQLAQDFKDELYGVTPSLANLRARLADSPRRRCAAETDVRAFAGLRDAYSTEHAVDIARGNQTRAALELEMQNGASSGREAEWRELDAVYRGIVAVQRRLACDRLLDPQAADGELSPATVKAVTDFQLANFLIPNEHIDAETVQALAQQPRELDFRLALRILRERVTDASGLIEDGSASSGPRQILGRDLDPAAMRAARGNEAPLPDGAEDLVGAATEAAARDLGWLSSAAVWKFLENYPAGIRVALTLPPVPAYHTEHIELSAELDRGDVWYDETPTERHVAHRPTLVIYAHDGGTKRPLVRWATTIGGWSDVLKNGKVVQRWKESSVGPRVWRRLYAAPTWVPPKTTPDRDLLKPAGDRWELKSEILGPGPRGAFGLMLLFHERAQNGTYKATGIGSHGSASVVSIVNGTSHGCHRMFNQLAVRLGNFLLRHRHHVVRGDQGLRYHRVVEKDGEAFDAELDTRGFLYELTPPIPITVLAGNIMSERKVPPSASAPADPD